MPDSTDLARLTADFARGVADTRQAARLRELLEGSAQATSAQGQGAVLERRDDREQLLTGQVVGPLHGLAPTEHLGPFLTHGGTAVWFDAFSLARRTEVREAGAPLPVLVMTGASVSQTPAGDTTLSLGAGTVWLRADGLGGGLPAQAFVGIRVKGGTVRIATPSTVVDDVVQATGPLEAAIELNLAPADAPPVPAVPGSGCDDASAAIDVPERLTLALSGGSVTAEGTAGRAHLWGQSFELTPSDGTWTFFAPLWTAVLGYAVNPRTLDPSGVPEGVVHLAGAGQVARAGLAFPVVATADPGILGDASHGARWALGVTDLTARWYVPDPRAHVLGEAWLVVSERGVDLLAQDVAPLDPPVTHTYDLWTIAGGSSMRLPWHQGYAQPFQLLHRCDVADGDVLLVRGEADVALDRPVTTVGEPVETLPGPSGVLLRRSGGPVGATLVVAPGSEPGALTRHQLALRNALVWADRPSSVVVRGDLPGLVPGPTAVPHRLDSGVAQLRLGVHAWAPTLPDPYVSNAVVRPRIGDGDPHSVLVGAVTWNDPATATVTFEGRLGQGFGLGPRESSSGETRPLRPDDFDPDVGPTQREQDALTFDRKGAAGWRSAQSIERDGRDGRAGKARQQNARSLEMVDGFLREVVGPMPGVLLLDVSTHQDLLGVALGVPGRFPAGGQGGGDFPVAGLEVHSEVAGLRVVALPQVQWEPVRTLDADQDIMTMGWFPTPLAAGNDGGATHIGARSQRLAPVIPEAALRGTQEAYREGTPVGVRTTFPFGLVAAVQLRPADTPDRRADLYDVTQPQFPDQDAVGGLQVTAHAEGGRPDTGGVSPMFEGRMRQLLNGVDLASGAALGLSVLGETLEPTGSVETVFNDDMATDPRVPVTRLDISGYGGSSFSDWNNPFAAFAEAAKVQFRVMVGRTALEVIKVNSVLHPWGIRVARSVTVERRPGGGVIRRDSGWQAFTPGLFDYRYFDKDAGHMAVALYQFDAGVFRGLFDVRNIRPATGAVVSDAAATLVPYYFDAAVALEGLPERAAATGVLGYLQTRPNGDPAPVETLQAVLQAQGPIGGPIDAWMDLGGSGLRFRAQRVEVGLAMDGGSPLFVATVRGAPALPHTGAWSVVVRPVAVVPAGGGEAVPVAESRGVPLVRRYPVGYVAGDRTTYTEPPLVGTPGDYRLADAADLLTPSSPGHDYALLQSTPTHAFLFPRPFVPAASTPQIHCGHRLSIADVFARSTSKGAYPPPQNTIELAPGARHLDVGAGGTLALSGPLSVSAHPTPLRLGGTPGHGTTLFYDTATLSLEIDAHRWEAEFTGLRLWSDIAGLDRITGTEMRVVGSTDQRPQVAELKTLMLQEIEDLLRFIPLFGARGSMGPIDLPATNAKHELKVEVVQKATFPPTKAVFAAGPGVKLTLFSKQSAGIDATTGGTKASATFGAALEGKIGPVFSVGAASAYVIIGGEITLSLTSVSGTVTAEKLAFMVYAGLSVVGHIGPFEAARVYVGAGIILEHDLLTGTTKYGGLVALEASVDLGVVVVTVRAELKGLAYDDAGVTKLDYGGSVKVQVELFLIFSINASYQVTETKTLS